MNSLPSSIHLTTVLFSTLSTSVTKLHQHLAEQVKPAGMSAVLAAVEVSRCGEMSDNGRPVVDDACLLRWFVFLIRELSIITTNT